MPRAVAAALSLLAAGSAARAVEPADVTLVRRGGVLRVQTGRASADVRLGRFRLKVRDLGTGRRVVRAQRDGGLFWERGGAAHRLGAVTGVSALPDGVALAVATDEGGPDATVTLRFRTRRTLEVALDPPDPATVTAFGVRFASPRREAIYGLTERLRDSPPFLPGVVDIPLDDLTPPEVGSLDRRGESVEMRVLPTFSLYAPFYHSSAGYGLAVSGTTIGVFDVAKTDPRTLSFRFEAGTTPESRRLEFHVFVAPDHPTILDEYTDLTGRPVVPPDWAFLHWRWRGELTPGTAPLDGTSVNHMVADDVLMYDALGIPAGVYLFDRPVLAGEYGFARWEWDTARLPNVDQMLGSLRAAATAS